MLAKLLLEKPGLLLLDEPTNHLDTDAISWLESYLKTWQGAIIVVSHDRWFLDQLCTHITELYDGAADTYIGNYTSFISQRKEKYRLMDKAYEQNQKERERQKKMVQQYYAWGRAGGGKNFIKAKAKERMLEKMEQVGKAPVERGRISLSLNVSQRGGNDVLTADNLGMAFDDVPLFSNLDIQLQKGDKAALIGANGVGKTTLLRIIASRLAPTEGEVVLGSGIEVGYYDQLQETLHQKNTVLDEMRDAFPEMADGALRNALASFLFFGDDVFKQVGSLSGGEKGRLSLLKLMLDKGNLLLLDEPTNHLDMDSREMLEDALCAFEGTTLFVSHDRYFINKVATRVLEMKPWQVIQYPGNWSDYTRYLEKQKEETESEEPGMTKTAAAKQKRIEKDEQNRRREAKKRIEQLENDIIEMEARLADIENALADPADIDEEDLVAMSEQYQDVQRQIDRLMQAWEEASTGTA